ncbi:probable chitinase 10 [Anopheles albimanus]|uniref:probable chitinase 10 n=1 Tax=Anopheles albimanus TaxID=7167 RepID=UPI001640AD6A|nr:probable chitinase 10 [Anopheles albimanus]
MTIGRFTSFTIGWTLLIVWQAIHTVQAQEFDPMQICKGKADESMVVNPLSCDQFLRCVNEMPAGTGRCPDGMLFDAAEAICNFADQVECGSVPLPPEYTTTTLAPTTTEQPVSSACPAEDNPLIPTYLPVLDDCSSYILCYHGKPLTMKCPADLEWNAAIKMCDTAANAKCQAIYQDPYGCPPEGTSFLPHPDRCNKYIFCLYGISRVQVCQMFKYFDQDKGECVFGSC